MSLFDHLLFSLAANLAVLSALVLLRTAPPRLVVNVCLAGMLMVAVPWPVIADWSAEAGMRSAGISFSLASSTGGSPGEGPAAADAGPTWGFMLAGLWLTVSAAWLTVTFASAARIRRRWRALALPGESLKVHVLEGFRSLADKVEIHRLPGSHTAMATGLWRREIWLGDAIVGDVHLATALNHELCHLDAGDHYVVHLISLLERLLWWNPLIWVLGGIARRHLEYDCDQRCKRHFGVREYRIALAGIALDRIPPGAFPGLAIGSASSLVTRIERLTMTYRAKPRHVLTALTVAAVLTLGSGALADDPLAPSLVDCNDRLPDGVRYRLEITSEIETGDGDPGGELTVSLRDADNPDSRDIPAGAGPYVRCVMAVLGAGESDLPDGV